MSKNKSLKQKLLKKTADFLKHCTIHGFYYFYSSANKCVNLFWLVVIASSIGLCGFLGHMIWNKFIIDPTFTVVETTHYPTSKIPFPAVIVCDTEMVYGPSTNNIKDILRLRGFQKEQIDDFFRSLTDIKLIGYEIQPHVKKMHSILESLGYTYNDLLNTFKKPCEVLIEKCVWRSKLINCSEMFRTMLTYLGYCCKFDLTYFSLHAEEGTNFAGGTEITEGLDITVNTDKYFSNGNKSDGYASLYVIDKDDKITILDNAITITSGAYFDATITVWLMDSSADVKALSLSNRKCFLDTDLKTGATSYQNCMMNLVMKKIIEYCQCIPFNFEASILSVEDFPACSWGRLNCVYDSLEFIQGNIREVVSHNDCYQNCDYIEYETEVEYLKRDRTVRIPRTNSRVTVHFEDNSCMKYRREVLYTWDQMLANLGGVFGLCLGGSIISIIEIIWFILDLLYTCCVNYKTNKVTHKSHRGVKEVFTISNKENSGKNFNKKGLITPRIKFTH